MSLETLTNKPTLKEAKKEESKDILRELQNPP